MPPNFKLGSNKENNIILHTRVNRIRKIMLSRLGLLSLPLWVQAAYAAFGLTDADGSYSVDTGAGLVFTVSQESCDLTSIVFSDTELQYSSMGSHIGSGLGSADVTATQDGMSFRSSGYPRRSLY